MAEKVEISLVLHMKQMDSWITDRHKAGHLLIHVSDIY